MVKPTKIQSIKQPVGLTVSNKNPKQDEAKAIGSYTPPKIKTTLYRRFDHVKHPHKQYPLNQPLIIVLILS